YCPGAWLKKGKNEIVVMDILEPTSLQIKGLDKPIIDRLHKEFIPDDAVKKEYPQNILQGNEAAPGAK
ncbi:MAG: hypothetical protein J6Q26_03170, partial [Bacteroidales bacterium]|nr:hypothetical protein [Bacteroidales bacterium]